MAETEAQRKKRIADKVAARAREREEYHAGVEAGTTPSKSSLTSEKSVTPLEAAYMEQEGVTSMEELSRTKESPTREPTVTTREPIAVEQGEPKKTGIAALREEDTLIGNAIRIATDWRTTVALVATLATLGIGAGVSGALATKAAQAATVAKFPLSGFALNAKTAALTTSLLSKAGMTVGVAAFAATAVGTYPFARFELAEATDKIGIAIFAAQGAGDLEEVARLQGILEELVNPSVWDSILSVIPFANVLNTVSKNIKAAQESAKSILQTTEKKVEASAAKAAEPSFAEEREASDVEARERELKEREEDKEYFEDIEEKKKAASEEQREEDKAFYEDVAAKKRKTELREREEDKTYFEEREAERLKARAEERLADEEYWKNIIEANAKRKADEREADEEYWAKIKGEALDDEDKKVISDWNAGKSALNFKWLGL